MTSHVVRPGTAEVIYVNQKDAISAVDAYHNRQLDGQPMKCLLVNSRSAALTSRLTVTLQSLINILLLYLVTF